MSIKLPLLKININEPKYMSVNRLFSFDWATYLMITGGRGVGKTTGLLGKGVDRWDKYGEEFVFVKRHKDETTKCYGLFDDICNNVKAKNVAKGTLEYSHNGKRMGYAVSLSLQQQYKSNGFDFSKVNMMIFDEAMLPKGSLSRYLPDEVAIYFLELWSTIFRNRKGYKVFLLGNNADFYNPYYAYFNVPIFESKFKDINRGLYCENLTNNPVLEEEQKATPLAKLTQGTNYYDYNFNNKLLGGNSHMVGLKVPNALMLCRFVYDKFTLNVYRNTLKDLYVEMKDKPIEDDISFVIRKDGKPNYPIIAMYRKTQLKRFIDVCYYSNHVMFDNERTASLFDSVEQDLR